MGLFDRFRKPQVKEAPQPPKRVEVGARGASSFMQPFTNSNITFSGSLSGYDYGAILRDKQRNIISLYQLADYYSDADAIIHGILKHVYVPFSTCSPWFLTGAKEKTVKLYEEQYKKMRLEEQLDGIMLEYWKYGNVVVYLHDGYLITMPIHKCRIGNVAYNGIPLVDYDCQSIINEWRMKSYNVKENWIKDSDMQEVFKGYPKEIQDALNKGEQYAQLNPENTFVMQRTKESWQRYAVPFIASCLTPLAKKELISSYEDAILNLGIRSFVHVTYGDSTKGQEMYPDLAQLTAVRQLFQDGMSGFPLVVTNHLAKAQVIQPNLDDLFQWNKYRDVNNDILSAGGISGVMVTGISDDGSTFASAQVSIETAEARINAARNEFCEMMNRINARLTEYIEGTYNLKEIPEFHFAPLSIEGKKQLREACTKLWESGSISTKTMLETNGYSLDKEKLQLEKEAEDGTTELMHPKDQSSAEESDSNMGRPTMDNDERTSDPENAKRSAQPKPSNPEGSESN